MKKRNVFLLLIIVIITGIIFANCDFTLYPLQYCPYCKSKSISHIEDVYNVELRSTERIYRCRYCEKIFGIMII
jgi:DNA-directed RNA polymerase subunit RPC12/RpoP